jgi:ribosomal protein L37AE/L43A
MVKIVRLEGLEEDLKRLILAFQERKPDWAKFMETRVECPVCGCHTIPYTEEDAWICQRCNSEYKELQDILKENGGKAQRRRTGSERSPCCEGEDCE